MELNTMHDDEQTSPPILASDLLELAEPLVASAALKISRRFNGFIEFDDLAQELRLWCWQNYNKISRYLEHPDPRDLEHGAAKLSLMLQRRAERAARTERARSVGYLTRDESFYNAGQVGELLEIVLAGGLDGTETHSNENETSPQSDPAEGLTHLAVIADVTRAWSHHPSPILAELYGQNPPSREVLAKRYEIDVKTLTRREQNDLRLLVEYLGGSSPW
jgi:hypothetical protein